MTKEQKEDLLRELIKIEEKNDIGNLTSRERGEFQKWVMDSTERTRAEMTIEMPTVKEMAKDVANTALDDICYEGKTIREWAKLICSLDIPENPTNGEVIKALFPKAEIYIQEYKDFKCIVVWFENAQVSHDFTWEWWNAPFKGVSE